MSLRTVEEIAGPLASFQDVEKPLHKLRKDFKSCVCRVLLAFARSTTCSL